MEANKANNKSFLGLRIPPLELCNTTVCKLYFWALCDRGWFGEVAALSIHKAQHPPQRETGKQMLMRHLTFNSITPPLCPLLLCGITVRYRRDWQQCEG